MKSSVTIPSETAAPEKEAIREIFDAIAPRYDLINSVLSFCQDRRWRRRACDLVMDGSERSLLDLGTGTGKFLEVFLGRKKWDAAVGLDFSASMLARGGGRFSGKAGFVCADFDRLPFAPASFDLVISAFVLRSVKDLPSFFGNVLGILTEGGKAAFLCLTRPPKGLAGKFHALYLKYYLPAVGRGLSGHGRAYEFLAGSVRHFQEPEATMDAMRRAGFCGLEKHVFTFGAATLIIGKKNQG